MKQKHSKKPHEFRSIASGRIAELFSQAGIRFKESPELANRYVKMARTISMKYKVPIPRELKRRFCGHCNHYLVPGSNSRVRLQKGKVVIFCSSCSRFTRIPIRP